MSGWIGVVVFVVGLVVSVTLHEFGHLVSAKAFGMKARRFFFGFGPTLWSFRRGETEYGIKAVPAGGFVDIAGMSDREELPPEDVPRAFYRASPGRRIVVMLAGVTINLVTGWVLLVVVLATVGVPRSGDLPPVAGPVQQCVQPDQPTGQGQAPACTPADPVSPAAQVGLRAGDRFLAVDGRPVRTWEQVVTAIQDAGPGPVTLVVERDGARLTLRPDLVASRVDGRTVGRLGVAAPGVPPVEYVTVPPWTAVTRATAMSVDITAATGQAIWGIPAAIPGLLGSITGQQQRSLDGFVSVVGAAQVSGQLAGTADVPARGRVGDLLFLIAGLNLTVGLINLVPLPPFDGGHMAAALYEVVRNAVLRAFGRPARGHVDPADYQGLTVIGVAVILAFGLLILTNDIVNPIRLPAP